MTTTHRISATTALILSLAAAGAPGASARPLGPHRASAVHRQSSIASRPHPGEQTVTGATAKPAPAAVYSRQDKSTIPATEPIPTGAPSIVAHVASPDGRFEWVDAGIGAAGGIALSLLGLGGMRGAVRYRTRHSTVLSG